MNMIKHSFVATMLLLIAVAGSVAAQSAYRLSEKEMKDLLSRIDKQAETFRGSLKQALNHSRFDDSKEEDRINDFVKRFEQATERLKHHYDEKSSASSDVEEVLNRAARIDDFMERHHLSPRAASDWAALRQNLDALAEAYNVSWNWTEHRR
jgi:Rad3-related DNA helicase